MGLISRLAQEISDEEMRAGETQCFVGHEFRRKDLRTKLKRALNSLGLQAYFADKEVTGDFILTKVCKKILATRASIVDLTGANPNVYYELGMAIGLNKPVFVVLKHGTWVPPLLEGFAKLRFTSYSGLERELVEQVPGWLEQSIEHHLLYNTHCHFAGSLCPDRRRTTPQRHYLIIDQIESTNEAGKPILTHDPDLYAELPDALNRFHFTPVFLSEVPVQDRKYHLCDYCLELRNSDFALCHLTRCTSSDAYLLLGLATGLDVPSLMIVHEERGKNGRSLFEIPTMLRGLDAFYYEHSVDIGERLGDGVEGFLIRRRSRPVGRMLAFPDLMRRDVLIEAMEVGEVGKESQISNLPPRPYSELIGRDVEIREIMDALRDPGARWVVAIHGEGGIGKTALALEVAIRCLDQRLFDVVIWERSAYQRRLTFEAVLDAIARRLGRIDFLGLDPQRRETQIKALLKGRQLLLILDGVENALEPQDDIVQRIVPLLNPGKALLTSREQFAGEVFAIPLRGLAVADAIRFIQQEARERGIERVFDARTEDLAAIAHATDGAPLTMKLVIARASQRSLEMVLRELPNINMRFKHNRLWDLLGQLEAELADLVEDRLILEYGNDWTEVIRSRFPALYEQLETRGEQIQAGKPDAGQNVQAPAMLRQFMSLSELRSLILANSALFGDVFGPEGQSYLDKQMSLLILGRNNLAHSRELSPEVSSQVEEAALAILNGIRQSRVSGLAAARRTPDPAKQVNLVVRTALRFAEQGDTVGLREATTLAQNITDPTQQAEALVAVLDAMARISDTEGVRRVIEIGFTIKDVKARDCVLRVATRAYEVLGEIQKAREVAGLLSTAEGRVFISNAISQNELARELAAHLKAQRISYFHYKEADALQIGSDWLPMVHREIERSDVFVAILSSDYSESKWCEAELQRALSCHREGKMRILPYLVEQHIKMPEELVQFQVRELSGYHNRDITIQPAGSVLIVTATNVEAEAVLSTFLQATSRKWPQQSIGNSTYYSLGVHGGAPVFMVQSKMGNAAPDGVQLTVRQAIQDLHPQAVIMCGVAFGLHPDTQKLGDILVATQLGYYEPQKVDSQKGQLPRGDRTTASERLLRRFRSGGINWEGAPIHFGLLLSGEKLVNDPAFRDRLLNTEPEAIGGEMEGAGLYAAARDAKVDWILLKAICDWANGTRNDKAQSLAANNAARFVLHVLQLGGWGGPEQLRRIDIEEDYNSWADIISRDVVQVLRSLANGRPQK